MSEALAPMLAAFAGLDPPPWALAARVRERAAALGLSDEEYVLRARADAAELAQLVELLRVGETRFFRHRAQLEALTTRLFPALRPPVAAWSAGCASGEEAWTLAMLLSERGLLFSLWATDLSTAALARARAGRYPSARLDAELPAPLAARYFRRIGDEAALNERLRPHLRFESDNLLAPTQPRDFDLILCRNVLIYFDPVRRARAVARLVRALKPGGWLLVGYSETLRDCAELSAEGDAIYRKRETAAMVRGPELRSVVAPAAWSLAARDAASQPPQAARPSQAARPQPSLSSRPSTPRRVVLRGDYLDGKRIAAELRAVVGDEHALVDCDGAAFLGDEAARVLRRAVEAAPRLEVRATRAPVRRWLMRHGIRVR